MQKKNTVQKHTSTVRRKNKRSRTALLLLLLFLLLPTAAVLATKVQAENMKQPVSYKYYTSIQVQRGDTLWEIAERYKTAEYSDIKSYIEEVKKINHLSTSKITDGMYLCIPYYSAEYKS